MKKITLIAAATVLIVATSCESEKHVPTNTQQVKGALPTCIIPHDASKDVILTNSPEYAFTYEMYTGVYTVSVYDMVAPGFNKLSFKSPSMSVSGYNNLSLNYFSPFEATTGQTINALSALMCSDYYYYTGESTITLKPLGTLTTVYFDVPGEYSVHAFPKRVCYGGATSTTYPDATGEQQQYSDTSATYMVNVDMDSKTGDITIFNARFAAGMPTLSRMVINGLTLKGDHEHGYKLEGNDIVPLVGEGNSAVPYPAFAFDEFTFYPTNNAMTECKCEFKVAGKYVGVFKGAFVK